MKEFQSFFGEIVGRNDLDFLNLGNREAIVQGHNDFTNNQGGVVKGLEVSFSTDKLSLIVNPGIFYTAGSYNSQNNQGGGERGELLLQYSARSLPETAPVGNTPQYLLIYAKIINSNIDPNPLKSNQIVTSRNLQTGENVPTRQYPQAVIVITNPNFASTLAAVEGVPLALIQVNYVGINKVASDGSIQYIDTSVRRNYIVGGSVDLNSKLIVDAGVPSNFLTSRMYQDNSVSGPKFQDNSITSIKIAQWDGSTTFNDVGGSGIANQNLKNQVVTEDKINYVSGVNNLGNRNYLFNSSFEILSGTTVLPSNWDVTAYSTSAISVVDFINNATAPKYGNKALQMLGAIDGSNNALNLQVSQIINFNEPLKDKELSAFFWAKQISSTDFTKNGTTGLRGVIDFLDDGASPGVLQSQIFGVISGVTTSNYLQFSTTTPIKYTGTVTCSRVRYTIGGNFNGSYFVDGALVARTSLIPGFDINPSEYVTFSAPAIILPNSIYSAALQANSVASINIQDNAVSASKILAGSIDSSKIVANTITNAQMANGSISSVNIQAGAVQQNNIALSSVDLTRLESTISTKMLPTAWATYNFNGGGIINSFNINSIVQRNGVGDYTFTFLNAMINNQYCAIFGGDQFGVPGVNYLGVWMTQSLYMTNNTVRIFTAPSSAGGAVDRLLCFVIFGGR